MENFTCLKVESTDETIMAVLFGMGADSILEEEDHFLAYFKTADLDEPTKEEIADMLDQKDISYMFFDVEPQNWNEIWEASFQPVTVGNFCRVRADFHVYQPGYEHDLVINPKMAFGTGHHATTWMMIDTMQTIDFTGKRVFDYGCGTGILAILASRLGAGETDAIDIEHEAYLNTLENCHINKVDNVQVYEGDIATMQGRKYDIILANINRNVLLDSVREIRVLLNEKGTIIISGIRPADVTLIERTYEDNGFSRVSGQHLDDWSCIVFSIS